MKKITAEELKKRFDKDEVILIDVREPAEYRAESIVGSIHIPLAEVSLDKLPITSMPIVMHCHLGRRSVNACEKIIEEDPSLSIYSLEGGIVAWKQAGFSVQKSGD